MREVVVQILHTQDGARAAMHCLWYGTAKVRNWLIAWLTDWLINCFIDWLTDWLTDWLIALLTDWLTDWLID